MAETPEHANPGQRPQDPHAPRLTRLEEHAAFTEHTVDQLSTEIAELNKRLAELAKKMHGLEDRLGKVLERLAGEEGQQ